MNDTLWMLISFLCLAFGISWGKLSEMRYESNKYAAPAHSEKRPLGAGVKQPRVK